MCKFSEFANSQTFFYKFQIRKSSFEINKDRLIWSFILLFFQIRSSTNLKVEEILVSSKFTKVLIVWKIMMFYKVFIFFKFVKICVHASSEFSSTFILENRISIANHINYKWKKKFLELKWRKEDKENKDKELFSRKLIHKCL